MLARIHRPLLALLAMHQLCATCGLVEESGPKVHPTCRHTAPDGRVFDLSAWAGTILVATGEDDNSFNVSLCENLPSVCHDSLTGAAMPPGAVFSLFAGQPAGTCWDVLAHWSERLATTFDTGCLALHFSHEFDAHLGCLNTNVTVEVRVLCDRAAHEPVATGRQLSTGCSWVISVRTADPAVCSPPTKGGAEGKGDGRHISSGIGDGFDRPGSQVTRYRAEAIRHSRD